jgi:hypothetical protein
VSARGFAGRARTAPPHLVADRKARAFERRGTAIRAQVTDRGRRLRPSVRTRGLRPARDPGPAHPPRPRPGRRSVAPEFDRRLSGRSLGNRSLNRAIRSDDDFIPSHPPPNPRYFGRVGVRGPRRRGPTVGGCPHAGAGIGPRAPLTSTAGEKYFGFAPHLRTQGWLLSAVESAYFGFQPSPKLMSCVIGTVGQIQERVPRFTVCTLSSTAAGQSPRPPAAG